MSKAYPNWAFELWCLGYGDLYCAAEKDYPISRAHRLFWRVRGAVLMRLFGWWWWIDATPKARVP